VTELGARRVPLTNGNLNIPKMTGGARATWSGEGRKIAKSQPAFGNVRLSAKRFRKLFEKNLLTRRLKRFMIQVVSDKVK
jgi:hypothetical protein